MKKSVVIVEDDGGLREQLIQILESAPDIKCLGAFHSAEQALPQILAKNPERGAHGHQTAGHVGDTMRRRNQEGGAGHADHHGHGL